MPVVTDLNAFAAEGDHALNVELILRQGLNAFGFEHDDLAALWRAEVVRHPVNEEMIAGTNPEFDNILALAEGLVTA